MDSLDSNEDFAGRLLHQGEFEIREIIERNFHVLIDANCVLNAKLDEITIQCKYKSADKLKRSEEAPIKCLNRIFATNSCITPTCRNESKFRSSNNS